MRILLQRVTSGRVVVNLDEAVDEKVSETTGEIGRGYVLLVGIGPDDTQAVATRLADKVIGLRLFPNDAGKFDHAIMDMTGQGDPGASGEILVVSQFTLFGSLKRGRRPDFTSAGPPAIAEPLCDFFAEELRRLGVKKVATGRFGADMKVSIENDGPVTLWMDSETM